jgi:hypothetical protein
MPQTRTSGSRSRGTGSAVAALLMGAGGLLALLLDAPLDGEAHAGGRLCVDADGAGGQQPLDPAAGDPEPGGDQLRRPDGRWVEELDLDRDGLPAAGWQRLGAQLPGPLEVERQVVAPAE